MTTSTRAEAKRLGVKFYATGKRCRAGHLSLRYTASGQCVACLRERNDLGFRPMGPKKVVIELPDDESVLHVLALVERLKKAAQARANAAIREHRERLDALSRDATEREFRALSETLR